VAASKLKAGTRSVPNKKIVLEPEQKVKPEFFIFNFYYLKINNKLKLTIENLKITFSV